MVFSKHNELHEGNSYATVLWQTEKESRDELPGSPRGINELQIHTFVEAPVAWLPEFSLLGLHTLATEA